MYGSTAPPATTAPALNRQGGTPTYLVPFTGIGSDPVLLTVTEHAEYLRGVDGLCAFCHGDPCAEQSGPETLIGWYFAEWPGAETCPCCNGRPT